MAVRLESLWSGENRSQDLDSRGHAELLSVSSVVSSHRRGYITFVSKRKAGHFPQSAVRIRWTWILIQSDLGWGNKDNDAGRRVYGTYLLVYGFVYGLILTFLYVRKHMYVFVCIFRHKERAG